MVTGLGVGFGVGLGVGVGVGFGVGVGVLFPPFEEPPLPAGVGLAEGLGLVRQRFDRGQHVPFGFVP